MGRQVRRMSRVAVVEDNDDFRLLLSLWLSPKYHVKGFPTGEDFLAQLKKLKPDLVILDNTLPGADGLEIARWIRAQGRIGAMPILFLTGARRSDLEPALRSARTAYSPKPLERAHLLECVSQLLLGLSPR